MSTDYSDIIAAADIPPSGPYRTRRGALKYQPESADWSLGRLSELRDYFASTYNKPLPVTVAGQGTIHNKWGYDHRNSADISLNPASEQGQSLLAEMQRRNIPFLAFDKAIPGVATGPHIHVGYPSHQTAAKYPVGSQVKRTGQIKRAQPADYSDIVAAAGDGEYDTKLTPDQEKQFQQWKAKYAPQDSGEDYDLRGAYLAGITPDSKTGHWPDRFKKPNHPTFSNESQYATGENVAMAGHWEGDTFVPPSSSTDYSDVIAAAAVPDAKPRQLSTEDAAWHFGMSPAEALKLSPKAYKVLEQAVLEDDRKKAAGQLISQPSTEYHNEMRRRAGLKPLGTGSSGIGELRRLDDPVVQAQHDTGIGVLRRIDDQEVAAQQDTGVGRLRRLDAPETERVLTIQNRVQQQRAQQAAQRSGGSEAQLLAQRAQPSFAEDFTRALQEDDAARTRYRELVGSLTDEDKQQLAALTQQLRGHGPVGRGVDIGVQRIAGGLMYKLAGLADIDAASAALYGGQSLPPWLGDYLRRQAGVGELAIGDIEAELPPPLRQQLADFLTTTIGSLPEVYAGVAIGGPTAGFAALGGLEAAGRKRPLAEIAKETAKGAVLGKVFSAAGGLEAPAGATLAQRALGTAQSGLAIGAGTLAVEKAFGASDVDAARSALTNAFLHGGMKIAGELGGMAQATERTLKGEPGAYEAPDRSALDQSQPAIALEGELKTPLAPEVPIPAAELRQQIADWTASTPEELARGGGSTSTLSLGELMRHRANEPVTEVQRARLGGYEFAQDSAGNWHIDDIANPVVENPTLLEALEAESTAPAAKPPSVTEPVTNTPEVPSTPPTTEAAPVPEPPASPAQAEMPSDAAKQIDAVWNGKQPSVLLPEKLISTLPQKSIDKLGELSTMTAPNGGIVFFDPEATSVEAAVSYATAKDQPRRKAVNLITGKEVSAELGPESGTFNLRALFRRKPKPDSDVQADAIKKYHDDYHAELDRQHEEMQAAMAAEQGKEPFQPRTIEEAADRYRILAQRMLYLNLRIGDAGGQVRPLPKTEVDALWKQHASTWAEAKAIEKYIADRGYKVNLLGEIAKQGEPFSIDRPGQRKGEGGHIDLTEIRAGLASGALKLEEAIDRLRNEFPGESDLSLRARIAPQPRDDRGQFAEGSPGSARADRDMLKREAIKYREQYKSLDLHRARREGLDIVNDDVATDYFTRLRRLAATHQPDRVEAIDRAENLFHQGKYGQATMLAESVFRGLPDKVNEYGSAIAASQLVERGLEPTSYDWRKVITEVKRRLRETGGFNVGGSIIYDVNKYPKGGLPDHAKIAYIVEPVIDALKTEAQRLIAEGKLKLADYSAHIRTQVDKILASSDFSDWHPINRNAARGALLDALREPPADTPPTTEATPLKKRSLPPTLARSGREPGTNLTYEPIGNVPTERRVADRIAREGVDGVETWYRSADPSAERTAAFIQLTDHYLAESARLADTAPEAAQSARAHAIELANFEAERATSIGQAEQMYSRLNRYTPAGVARDVAAMQRRGVEVPEAAVEALTRHATEYQRADRDVQRLERRVADEEAREEAAAPAGTGGGGGGRSRATTAPEGDTTEAPRRPRRYRPRTPRPQPDEPPAERARRQLDEAARRRRAAARAIARQQRALEQQRTLAGYWRRSMNITRGLMVSSFSTAMRNLQTQLVRFDAERLTDVVEHTLRRSVGLDSDLSYRNIWRNTLRQFQLTSTEIARRTGADTGEVAEAREILGHHTEQYARMFNAYAGGVEVPIHGPARNAVERVFGTLERGVELANIFNRIQEFHVRAAEFLAEVDLHLRREQGQSLEQYVQRHGIDAIPQAIVERGVSKALEVTFADMPLRDGAGGRFLTSLIELGNYLPPTLSPVAFPRFMFNNLKFLYQYSPAGMLDVVRSVARNASVARDIRRVEANAQLTPAQRTAAIERLTARQVNIPRAIARTLVGTGMFLLAYQFRKSDHAGEKWYELKVGGHTLDARPFGPFSTYLFFAEALRRALNGEQAFTVEEIAGAIGASSGPGGTALEVAQKLYDYAANGEWDKWQRIVKTEAGEWGKALLTPIRQVKDLIAAFDSEEGIARDTGLEPFLGRIKTSIPFADRGLPPAVKPTTAVPIHQEHPAVKALTGWRVVTPKSFLEGQLDDLNFTSQEVRPATGIPEIDQYEKAAMGPLMDDLSRELERDSEWKKLSKAARGKYLRDFITDIRDDVRKMGRAEHPDWYERLDEQRKPKRDREYNREQNSPGLSKAIQLGVPMTIPPQLPGEDDIAYRARLLQLGRERRQRLDNAMSGNFPSLGQTGQRLALRQALYS